MYANLKGGDVTQEEKGEDLEEEKEDDQFTEDSTCKIWTLILTYLLF